MGQSWSRWRANRDASALKELAPPKIPGQDAPLPKLTKDALVAALQSVAKHISKDRGHITVIAVGGAVNTIHLQTRAVTHDVDFFNNRLTTEDFDHLVNGARYAAKKNKDLEEEWFNNRTIFFIPKDRRAILTDEAFQQGEVIFQEPGLTVLAAPWHYAFCCKIDRVAGAGLLNARPYDLDDAAHYLARYLSRAQLTQVQRTTVGNWFSQYGLRWTNEVDPTLTQLNANYRNLYRINYDPILMSA